MTDRFFQHDAINPKLWTCSVCHWYAPISIEDLGGRSGLPLPLHLTKAHAVYQTHICASHSMREDLDWLWLVMDPGPESELGDILYHPGGRLRDWCVGGAATGATSTVTLHVGEKAARADAFARLGERDHG